MPVDTDFDLDVSFPQTATNCEQKQTRTVQNREQNDTSHAYRNVGDLIVESKTLKDQVSKRTATGTRIPEECSYVFGSTDTMSAWIANDKNKNVEIWWKGVKLTKVTSATVITAYVFNGFKYMKSGKELNKGQMDDNGHSYLYSKICRTAL